ncbi:MAG: nSTAND1 domain-containing NTPase [Anaerolineae bacterium]
MRDLREFANPYDPTRPVQERSLLYGRDDTLLWIGQQLSTGRRLLIVHGAELIGKSSLTLALCSELPLEIQCCVLFACKPYQGRALSEAWNALAHAIADQIGGGQAPLSSSAGEEDPSEYLCTLLHSLSGPREARPVLLILDDVHLLWTGQQGQPDEPARTRVLEVLTNLLGTVPFLRLFLTMSEGAFARLSHPLLHGAEVLHLGPLSNEDAQQLITRPAQSTIRFDPGAVRRVADLASNHPYYLQRFCYALFERCAREGNLNQSDVDVVLEEMLRQPDPRFQAIWEQSNAVERAALVAMSRLKGTHGLTTRQEVIAYLQRLDHEVPAQPIVRALDQLARRGVLVRMGALSYRFAVKLFSYWLERHFTPERVLGDIDWEHLEAPAVITGAIPESADEKISPALTIGYWVIAGLGAMALLGLLLWGLIFAGVWQVGLFETPDPPTISPLLVDAVSPIPTSTPTPLPPTPTPTSPIIITRTMPSIVFRARNVGGVGDLPNWQIFVMNVDGSGRQRLTFTDNEDITPIWSPDGRWIAYVSKRSENREVMVMPVPNVLELSGIEASRIAPEQYETRAINITRHPSNDWTIGWSPDSAQIAFSSNRGGYWQVFVARADGTATYPVTSDGVSRLSPVWSPDYKWLAYSAKRENNWDIYVMPAPGPDGQGAKPEQERRLTFAEGNDLSPMYSPDGRRIAFESNRDGNTEIYVMNADGSNQRNVSNFPGAADHGPVWSPDGRQIMFYSNRTGNWDIFVMSSDGRNVVNLTNTPDVDEQEPFWRP